MFYFPWQLFLPLDKQLSTLLYAAARAYPTFRECHLHALIFQFNTTNNGRFAIRLCSAFDFALSNDRD